MDSTIQKGIISLRSIDKAIILMLGRVFSSSTIILLSVLLARSLSKADYGTYVQISMIVQLCGVVLSFGLPSSLTYFLPKTIDKRNLILKSYIILIAIGILGFIILYFLKDDISVFFNNKLLSNYIIYAGFGVLFYLASLVTRPILMYRKDSLLLAKIEIFRSALFLCSMVVCVVISPRVTYIISIFIACIVVDFIFSLVIVAREVLVSKDICVEESVQLSSQIRYSLPLGMSVICWYSGKELDKYVISHYMNPDDLAIYSRGAIELPLVHLLASTISQLKQPDWVAQWDSGNYGPLIAGWHNTIIKAALVVFPSFIFLELVGSDFISLLYSEKYSQSAGIFYLYLLLLPLQITSYTAIVESTGKNKFVLIGYVVQISVSVLISGFSIKYLGWYGPALVSVAGMYVWTLYVLIVISKIFRIEFREVFPWHKLAKIMIISAVSGVIPLLLLTSTSSILNQIILQKEMLHALIIFYQAVVFVFCFILLSKKYALIDQDDIDTIYRWLFISKIRNMLGR